MKEVIGCYKIHLDKKINEGSQASIYECTNTDSNSRCCARVINKRNQNGQINQQSYNKEFQVLEQLKWIRHDNILAIYDYKEEENYIYQFCDICDQSLPHFMTGEKIQKLQLLDFIKQISSGYLILKKKKIIHRDLKPENILIKEKDHEIQYKIADFGISKLIDDKQRINTRMVGTQQYSSPEMLYSEDYSYESDIFSFGIILFEKAVGNLELCNTKKKQKGFLEALKTQSFKQYIENLIGDEIQEKILDILDKLIVYDPQKRMTWEDLNLLATNQLKEYYSYLEPVSDFRQRGGASLFQSSCKTEFSSTQNLTLNQNFQNLQNSQVKIQNIRTSFDQINTQQQWSNNHIQMNQSLNQNQIEQLKQFGNQQFGQITLNKQGQNIVNHNLVQAQKENKFLNQSIHHRTNQNQNANFFNPQQNFQNGK